METTVTFDGREQQAAARALEQIGPYRLLGLIGEGGMGVVYLAEQTAPVRRRVAIKVTRVELGAVGRLARFESERQMLATLRHPNIAQVLDAGETAEGFPYLVMEYVPGEALDGYADQQRLDLRARIALLIQACAAIAHAHQMGILHRDIKPANLLVEGRDGEHHLKLIDFGIARLIERQGMLTETGQVPGTPLFMSPEQRQGAADIDMRSDVYSLGVTATLLLAGSLPERKLEAGELLRPSDLLPRGNLDALASARQSAVSTLRRALGGDLGAILAKALHPERTARYHHVSDFADDLDRYRHGLPVLARPPTAGYLLARFVSRRRTESTLIAALLLLCVASGVLLFQAWREEKRAHAEAEAQLRLHQSLNAFVVDHLISLKDTYGDRPVQVRELIEHARRQADERFADDPASRFTVEMLLKRSESGLPPP